MKLIWHIIWKDIRRDQRALLLWALLFVAQVVLGVVARHPGEIDQEFGTFLQIACASLVFLQVVMCYILVARLVQTDALIGTTVFWGTRPISPVRLFLAKALGVLLIFGLLPVLLLLPWWIYCAFGWREILWAAVDTLGWQLLVIAPAFLVASLTDDLGRVLLWTLLLVIGLFSWIVLLQASFGVVLGRATYHSNWPGVMFTKLWLSGVLVVVGGTAIAVHQYLTRRFVRSLLLVAGCLGLVALIGLLAPLNWGPVIATAHRPTLPGAPGVAERLSFAVDQASGTFGGHANDRGIAEPKLAALRLRLRVEGLPDDLTMAAERADQTWTWADGMKLNRTGFYDSGYSPVNLVLRRTYSLPTPVEDPESVEWHRTRQESINERLRARGRPVYMAPESGAGKPGLRLMGNVSLPNSLLAKMKTEPPTYRAEMSCILFRPVVVTELPFKDGVKASGRAQTYRLLYLADNRPVLVATQSSVVRGGLWFSAAFSDGFRSWLFRQHIEAMNRVTGDIVDVRGMQKDSREFQIAGVVVYWNILHLSPRMVIRDGKETIKDPQWAEHTTLVMLSDQEIARFEREVWAEKFELRTATGDQ